MEETLSAESDHEPEELDDTLPYSYDIGYQIGYDAQAPIVESSESESESEDQELLTHKFVPDGEPAPFSSSFVEEEEEEEEEEHGDGGHGRAFDGELVKKIVFGRPRQNTAPTSL